MANTYKEESLDGAGGLKIFTRSWRPGRQAARSHRARARLQFAQWLLPLGRGAVVSQRARGVRARLCAAAASPTASATTSTNSPSTRAIVDLIVKLARSREPGLPMFMLGHSAGGVIACNYVLDHQADFAGLVCESFAYQVPAPDFALSVLKGLSHLAPHAHVLKLKKEDFSRDPKVTRALLDDPLLAE